MIPKIIHYCWLSNDPIPAELQKCMDSWKKYLPDYEFMLWNFKRFPRGKSKWVDEAFDNKKYAFAADYIRLYALYNYGGFYMDMDVEVLKSFNPLLHLKDAISYENSNDHRIEMGIFGIEKGRGWVKECLNFYDDRSFIDETGHKRIEVLPVVIAMLLKKFKMEVYDAENIEDCVMHGGGRTIAVLPYDYFSPKSYETGKIHVTKNSFTIHHFAGTWTTPIVKLKNFIRTKFPLLRKVYNFFKGQN